MSSSSWIASRGSSSSMLWSGTAATGHLQVTQLTQVWHSIPPSSLVGLYLPKVEDKVREYGQLTADLTDSINSNLKRLRLQNRVNARAPHCSCSFRWLVWVSFGEHWRHGPSGLRQHIPFYQMGAAATAQAQKLQSTACRNKMRRQRHVSHLFM